MRGSKIGVGSVGGGGGSSERVGSWVARAEREGAERVVERGVDEGAEREMEGVEGWDVESEREVESWEMDWNDDLSESRDASRANARDFICVHPLSDLCAAGKERDVPFVLCRSLLSVRDDGYTPDSASLHPVPVSL